MDERKSMKNKTIPELVEETIEKLHFTGWTVMAKPKYREEFRQVMLSLVDEVLEEVVPEKIKTGKSDEYWECPEGYHYHQGREGEYCPNCRKKLVKKVDTWHTEEDESYNQAIDDIQSTIKKLKGEI
jgi:hypothetical protein